LNHMDEDAVRGTYNDAAYHEQRRRLSQWWADYLDELRNDLGIVVQLRARS
jgi:uncharacterized protein HemY